MRKRSTQEIRAGSRTVRQQSQASQPQPEDALMTIRRAALCILAAAGILAVLSAPALAAPERAGWELTATSYPTNLAPGGVDETYEVEVNGGAGTFTLSYEG